MTGWGGFELAFAAFLGTHLVSTRPPSSEFVITNMRRRDWLLVYAVVPFAVTA